MRAGLLIGCLWVALGMTATATPMLVVDQPDFNFGTIGQGYMVKHEFTLRNVGDQTLNIVHVRASCGCTTTALPTSQLAPGASVPLEVLVLADHAGTKQVTVYIYTNGPDSYGNANNDRNDFDVKLYVRGSVSPAKQEFETAPYELAYDITVLVDVRDASSYAANHLIGAIHALPGEVVSRLAGVPRSALVIVYDLAGEAADDAVRALVNAGYMSAYYLQGGLSRWVAVQGGLYLVNSAPLPPSTGTVTGGSSGRPWNQGQLRNDYYVLIDLRDAQSYEAGHLIGALNIAPAQLSEWFGRIPPEARIILYDDDGTISAAVYNTLRSAGFAYTTILLGGLDEWVFQYGNDYVTTD